MKRSRKQELIESLKKDFSDYNTAIAVDYRGLKVAEINELRNKLREESCLFKVVKNTLSIIASEGTSYESLKELFQGPTAVAFCKDNPVNLAKILTEYSKQNKNLQLKMGILKGKVLTPEQIKEVAKLPSKEVLLGQLVGVIQAPIRNVLSIIHAPARSMATVLKSIADLKEKNSSD